MIAIRRSGERGHLNHGWLDTYHSFSFGDYYDPQQMGFRSLRVINEDVVAPGRGFGMHPHRDMEILTWVLSGSLEHRDSLGSAGTIAPGQLQYMCAGRGILHSEFNPSPSVPVHLMQIWIVPRERGLTPRYDQRTFAPDAAGAGECYAQLKLNANGSENDGWFNEPSNKEPCDEEYRSCRSEGQAGRSGGTGCGGAFVRFGRAGGADPGAHPAGVGSGERSAAAGGYGAGR